MGWKNCSECRWSYDDRKGGCRNSACKKFDRSTVSGMEGAPKPSVQGTGGGTPTMGAQTSGGVKTLAPPKFVPSTPILAAASNVGSVVPDTPIQPWIETAKTQPGAIAPKGVPLKAEPFTLTCYRGEKSEWWPEPRMRLACGGMHVFEPWPGNTIPEIWKKLVEEVRKAPGFTVKQQVAAYAQYLRKEGRPFALASARTTGGKFEGYAYVIEMKNARTFLWGKNLTLGPLANFKDTQQTTYERIVNQNVEIWTKDTIDTDYIVLNADTIAESTILGFGHKTGTYEVTFMHDIPLSFVKSVNGEEMSSFKAKIYSEEQVEKQPDSNHKQTALKLFRERKKKS